MLFNQDLFKLGILTLFDLIHQGDKLVIAVMAKIEIPL